MDNKALMVLYHLTMKHLSMQDVSLNLLAHETIQHHIERAKQQEQEPCDYIIDISPS